MLAGSPIGLLVILTYASGGTPIPPLPPGPNDTKWTDVSPTPGTKWTEIKL